MGLEIRKDHQVMAMTKKHVDADDAGYGGDDLVLYVDADNHDKLDEHADYRDDGTYNTSAKRK